MGKSRFPGKPLKFQNRKRISVLSGVVYNETSLESQPPAPVDGPSDNVFAGEKEEEEKKENKKKDEVATDSEDKAETKSDKVSEPSTSPVRTRSQNKMEPGAVKPKPVKKTVTFGTVEHCEDTFLPLKKLPSKNQQPLVPIIKKKSSLKQTEYSTFSSILKPAKLTDLSSKSSLDLPEGFVKKNLNPLAKSVNKFSQFSENRCLSPPPRNTSPEKDSKFVLPVRSAHSSRVIKPNKKFIDGDENPSSSNVGSKLIKKPMLKKVVFNSLVDDECPQDENTEKPVETNKQTSSLFKGKTKSFSSLSVSRKSVNDLFGSDKEQECVQDENSNVEDIKLRNESQKEGTGHALRKLVDISDASSTSSTSSGSESEESWDSDAARGSGEEDERPPSPEKAPSSQLLSGKVIIREARLQLSTPVQTVPGADGPFSTFTSCSSPNPPTTVTCGVCGAVRFYKFVKQARKFGIYSCESCRKFVSKMIKKEKMAQAAGPVVMHCLKREGNCHVPPIVRSQQWKFKRCANKSRCPACWLKMCLKAFQVPPSIRTGLTAMLPAYMKANKAQGPVPPVNPLRLGASNALTAQPVFGALSTEPDKGFSTLKPGKKDEAPAPAAAVAAPEKTEDKPKKEEPQSDEQPDELMPTKKRRITRVKVRKKDSDPAPEDKRQKVELKGPRVKHVCRSASIVLGQPIATFPERDSKPATSDDDAAPDKDSTTPEVPNCDIKKQEPEDPRHDESEAKKRKVDAAPVKSADTSEDESVAELPPRKVVMKPLANITNSTRVRRGERVRPELVCVDFWESYDPDEVCASGFGVIGSAPFTVARLCFLCGSAGKEKMQACTSCCEWYHPWCAEHAARGAGWRCARCVACGACGQRGARARCRVCAAPHHAACLPRADRPQICAACLKCKSCDSARVTKFVGALAFCAACFRLRQKGNYCPLCQACYKDNDFDSKMMECGWCARWVHASCEGLSGEGYQLLSALPPSIEYICRQCMPHDPPWRKLLTDHLKSRLLHLLKQLAKNKKACDLLKLTPHKNTPVPSKSYRLMSPQAIRKLRFDDDNDLRNTTETKVYRNTSRRRNLVKQENPQWPESLIDKEMPHTQKVVNLQEPLMQNKEIVFSTGVFGHRAEFAAPCVEVHENSPATAGEPVAVHVDKYEAISDDDEPMKEEARSEQDLSPALARLDGEASTRLLSPSLLDIKKRVNCDEYVSLKDFNHDMKEVITRTSNVELQVIYQSLFTETFPWFDCGTNCLQPNLEVEGEHDDTDSLRDQEMSESKAAVPAPAAEERAVDQVVPKLEAGPVIDDDSLEIYPVADSRVCVLCKAVGDGAPDMEGRLLYCGQNDWIHANCALWSAEVFEEIDGSLQNVHSAISRGKMIKCAACELKGASVGCCAKNCSETYHYACARREDCAFLDDKRVFCPPHGKDVPKKSLQKHADFELSRPVYVELDKKKKRYSEISKVQFLLGSLTVQSLGKIVPSVSDYEEFLMPVDFSCTRIFWSCKKPTKLVRYTIKTKLLLAEPLPGFDFGVNITVDHSKDALIVDRVMAEIGAWHESLVTGAAKMIKHDKSPKKGKVTLEDFAVKQVVDFLVDTVCKLEQDDDEPQNTADLLPPELKDAIFEDLNHDLLDGISMQDIFPKLMSYEDLVNIDLKNEFYGAMSQSDDKSDKSDSRSNTDFIDELLTARLESGSKELKRSKSEMLLQNHNLKSLTTGRGQQRSSSLTWNNKFDSNLLSSTIKRCKMGRTSTVTGKLSPVQRAIENTLETIKETDKKPKPETSTSNSGCDQTPHTSGVTFNASEAKKESEGPDSDKTEGYYTDVIDFYTKIQCSPISQLDGAADWSGSESTCSSRPNSPREDFSPITQLDGADDNLPQQSPSRNQGFLYRATGSESTYTVTIAGNSLSGQPELVMRPLDDVEQPVRCDRCQCTYRNKESYDRHVPSCDMMSTSESESENPKSPENRTLTTLQNAFQGAFAQPMIIHAGVVSGTENTVKAEGISARRTSINTRQITINGTIIDTPSPGPSNEMTMTITEQMKSGTVIFDQSKSNVQVSGNQQMMSSPQIVVTPQMLLPPKTSQGNGQKMMTQQIITPQGVLPYNICVKPGGSAGNIQQINSNDMAQLLSGSGGIQVLTSNANQVLIPTNQQGNMMIHGKTHVNNFPNMASASSITLPVNSLQGMPNAQIIQNIQPMIRPNLQGNTIVVPAMQRISSPNQGKQQILMPGAQKSPKKHSHVHVQPKPIYQATSRGRGRPIPKPTTIKRQTKVEKTYTTINQPLGSGNTVIQLQTNNQTGQPSIIVQPVTNQNIMSAYVEALSQQQNQNMQYIATIGPQGDFKGPTQFISQGGLVPQTFQIQQTENGGLVAVPSGGIPVLLPQGNVGILPQTLQQGTTILPQGTIQQGIISQGPNGPTILGQNGATLIPQGTIQSLTSGNMTSQATLLPSNMQGGTVVQSGIGNTQGATLLPNGTLLPQFCNDQVLLGSTPTLEMVTDSSGCMYLTTQPVYYGLETIVQNTVMSSQQFVSTAMQGVLAQNSSFSATTTQVFQASKIEPIVEVPTGYVVVNNVGEAQQVASSTPNVVAAQTVQTSPQALKTVKTPVPNLTLQPLPDKSSNANRQTPKVIQMGATMGSQATLINRNVNPITSQIHGLTLSSASQNFTRANHSKANTVSLAPNVTLVSSTGQPIMAISQSVPNSMQPFSLHSIPLTQPIVSSAIAPSMNKPPTVKIENAHVIEIGTNMQDNNHMPTINVTQSLKSPTPWRQVSTPISVSNENKIELQNIKTSSGMNAPTLTLHNNVVTGRNSEQERSNQRCMTPVSTNTAAHANHLHQYDSSINASHHPTPHTSTNNVIQISAGNIYQPPTSSMGANFDAETAIKLSKINALSKTEGGHLTFSQEIMASHSQQHAQNEKTFQNIGNSEPKHMENVNNQINIHKLNSCQMAGNNGGPSINIVPHNVMRTSQNQNTVTVQNNQNQMCSMPSQNNSHGIQIQPLNSSGNVSCQEMANRANENANQSSSSNQHDMNASMNTSNHGNVQMMSLESHHSNQIHIMSGRQIDNNPQLSQPNLLNQGTNRQFHENVNMPSNRATPDNTNIMNQSHNMHNMGNSHMNRSQTDMNHMHMQQSMNNMQNNRMIMDNMQGHSIGNIGHQMHSNRAIDMHNQMQMNHHNINNANRQDNMHLNQQMSMQANRQMDAHHHQHPMNNVMQIQNNRQHMDTNLMAMHHNLPNQIHGRQLDSSMHMHHMSANAQNMAIANQMDGNLHNRHENNSMPNIGAINQMQNNRSMEHANMMQHQMSNMGAMNNMNMHGGLNSSMQMANPSHQPMMHVPNIPDIKPEMQSCSGSCSNNPPQFGGNQSSFDMCANAIPPANMMHGMNVNNANIMMNVNNSNMYGSGAQGSMGHDMLMSCTNPSDQNLMSGNSHMMMNNQGHSNNQNQMLGPPVANNAQINISSCSMAANNVPQNLLPLETQMTRNSMGGNEQNKFGQESCRKNVMGPPPNPNMSPMPNTSNDCKVNIGGQDKQSHTISVNNQMNFMQMNSQNRVINLPERGRMNNSSMETNMTQHMSQQHNIRVVTNNNNNVGNITADPLNFQPKNEPTGTMINVPFQAIPNSAPMNINVNSSNNTVNITVQNNLVDPKIASKSAADLNFPIQTTTNLHPNQNASGSMICIPVQNSTINVQTQNSSSITLPKAPPTQQSGIPTNVVNPMSMRPMNRVLPLHRDGQSKAGAKPGVAPKAAAAPKPRPVSQDMPDLNVKDETVDSDLEKAIEESKRMMELERVKREKEQQDTERATQLSTPARAAAVPKPATAKMPSLPSLDAEMEEPPKVFADKDKQLMPPKLPKAPSKLLKRPLCDKKTEEPVTSKKQSKTKGQENIPKGAPKQTPEPPKDDGPKLIYEVSSEDGFTYSSSSLTDLWAKVVEAVQNARKAAGLPAIQYNLPTALGAAHLLGLNNNGLRYLIEQLPGVNRCTKYRVHDRRALSARDTDLALRDGFRESAGGAARAGPAPRRAAHDMFAWMASRYRDEPPAAAEAEPATTRRLATLPLAMRFRHLKETARAAVGVFRSHIHGRGLFCKREIEEGDMVIEYAGEVVRAAVADRREKRYEAARGRRGVAGCYMFRIDDQLVVDATLKGNSARFINHSCDPNCYSRVVDIHGHKHILIFALRRIAVGEELTYDYKFPFEDVKIPCTCGAKKCRKYLN